MSGKFIRNWVITLVVLFVLTTLWHVVIFSAQYSVNLANIARYVDGTPTPLLPYFVLAHIVAALGFVMYIPAVSRTGGQFIWNGVVMGWVTFAFFAILSHALFAGWNGWLMTMDISFGTIAGAITGGILKKLS